MKRRFGWIAGLSLLLVGCGGPEWLNFIAPMPKNGTIVLKFVNETPYNVSTSYGLYNPLDVQKGMYIDELTLGISGESVAMQVPCLRELHVAGPALRQAAQSSGFGGAASIADEITFKMDDGTAVGTAPAAQFLLGVDYAVYDELEIHFKQVPGTTDQFVVEMVVIAHHPEQGLPL